MEVNGFWVGGRVFSLVPVPTHHFGEEEKKKLCGEDDSVEEMKSSLGGGEWVAGCKTCL
jgi:hypothetical protein